MAGLFDGVVQENPIYVDNSEKYAKRAELARDRAMASEKATAEQATIAKNEATSARVSADSAKASELKVDGVSSDVKTIRDDLKSDKAIVAAYRKEVLDTKEQFDRDVEAVSEDREVVTILKNQAEASQLSAKASEDKALEYREDAKHINNSVGEKYQEIASLEKSVETKHSEVAAFTQEAKEAKDLSVSSASTATHQASLASTQASISRDEATKAAASTKEADRQADISRGWATNARLSAGDAEEFEALSKEWYEKSYDLYVDLKSGQVYRGVWDPKTGAYPDHQGTNSVWDVIVQAPVKSVDFDGKTWRSGDRLVYVLAENKYDQITSGSTVTSINGKSGAVSLDATDVGALPLSGGTMTGMLNVDGGLTLKNNYLRGMRDNIIMRDHGNGNVTLSASKSEAGVAGELYLGYNGTASGTSGYNTLRVRLDSPMNWKNSHSLVDGDGLLNSERMVGPIRTEKDSNNVWHTIVGGTDTVNRGRTIIAAGEAGKHIYDNTSSGAEEVHIGGDSTGSIFLHTDLQNGWASRKTVKVASGELYVVDGGSRVYHEKFKPTPAAINAVNKTGDDGVGSLTLAADKVLNATLTHQRGYFSMYPYSTGYGLGGASGNRVRMYYKEHNNGNPSDLSRGIVVNSHDADGTSHPVDMWLGGQKVYHTGYKPTASDVGALSLTGGEITGNLKVTNGINVLGNIAGTGFTHANKQLLNHGTNQVYLGNREGVTELHLQTNNGLVYVSNGPTNNRVYHEGFKPVLSDVAGAGASVSKRWDFERPSGLVDGKFYPIVLTNTNNYPDVLISTSSGAASSPMNHCTFKGVVRSGGWSDKGKAVSGDFIIYDASERAIHSIVGGTESDNHYVVYVAAQAFPLSVIVDGNVDVSFTGKEVVFGTTTYRAGISGMTTSADYGTKTLLLRSFDKGNGFYSTNQLPTNISVSGAVYSETVEMGPFTIKRNGNKLQFLI